MKSIKLLLAIAAMGMLAFAANTQSFLTNGFPAGVAIGAVSNITANGGANQNVLVDSYNSYNTNYSVDGEYTNTPGMTESNGDVASEYGFVNFGNQVINGNLYLGADASTSSSTTNNLTGTVFYNYNVQFPDVTLPSGASSWPIAAPTFVTVTNISRGKISTATITAYDFTTSGSYIVNQDLPIVVEAGVTVNLNVTSTTFSGSGLYIYGSITPTGPGNAGTAILFFNGPASITISGNTAINANNRPENLTFYGLPSLTSINITTIVGFTGVIYAPEANLVLNGGGNGYGIMGSVIVNSLQEIGHYNIHFDESLMSPQLRIVSQPTNQAVPLGSNATFTVSVTGAAPIGYQWFYNQTNGLATIELAGGTSYSALTLLTLTNVQTSAAGNYFVVISNAYNSVTSSYAHLTVVIIPPIITAEPTNQIVLAGSPAIFGVSAFGSKPFSYQWQLNGTNLPGGIITTVAGNGTTNYSGDGGTATNAGLYHPGGVAVDSSCNLFIADTDNNRIRKVSTGGIITTVAGSGPTGFWAGSYSGDGGAATNATLNLPNSVAVDANGNLFIADFRNDRIREVSANGIITTVAGGGVNFPGNGGAATNAAVYDPVGLTFDANGNLFFAENDGERVRKVTTNGIITIVAGSINGGPGFFGDGGPATNASLNNPSSVAVDTSGNLFIADAGNECIRKVSTNGIITTFAGSGPNWGGAFSGDGGVATNATLNQPIGVALDASGNLLIADTYNQRIREVNASSVITTIAGNGTTNYLGDGGAATNASFNYPTGVALDPGGNIFIPDWGNNCIRRVSNTQGPFLFLNPVGAADAGSYSVVITNAGGVAVSWNAALTVVFSPNSQTNYAGTAATFTVQTFGPESLNFQWQKNGANLVDGGNISGSTSNQLTIANVSDADAASYSAVVSDATTSVTTSNATLTVIDTPPAITVQPLNQQIVLGSSTSFTVAVSGTPPFQFQWQLNQTNILNATNAIYTVPAVAATDAGYYSVVVTNPAGSVISSNALLTVIIPPTIGLQFLNGSPVFNLSGMLSNNFVVQYNTDLTGTNWIDLLSISNLTSSPYQFVDPDGIDQPARFYRVIMQ